MFIFKKSIILYELTWLEGDLMKAYLHDVREVQGFAMLNREIMLLEIEKKLKLKPLSYGESVHNYVDENMILRKGAAAAYEDDVVIIPINMRDGIILGRGKGNAEWNFSAPHGAGRLYSRSAAKYEFTVEEYAKTMKDAGIYSTCIDWSTLDECPMAYKGMEDIVNNIEPTAEIVKILKPIYNFKATSQVKKGETVE